MKIIYYFRNSNQDSEHVYTRYSWFEWNIFEKPDENIDKKKYNKELTSLGTFKNEEKNTKKSRKKEKNTSNKFGNPFGMKQNYLKLFLKGFQYKSWYNFWENDKSFAGKSKDLLKIDFKWHVLWVDESYGQLFPWINTMVLKNDEA